MSGFQPGSFSPEGALDLSVRVFDGVFSDVTIVNRRPLSIASALAGQGAGQVSGLCSRLFTICRAAQGLASAEAVEHASGLSLSQPQTLARQMVLLAEIALEHAGRALMDWPQLLGDAPYLADVKTLRRALADFAICLYPDGDWMTPGGGRLLPDQPQALRRLELAQNLVEATLCPGNALADADGWNRWWPQGQGPVARLAQRISALGLEDFGASAVPALPDLPLSEMDHLLAVDRGVFAAAPTWDGQPHLTGAFARQADHLLISQLGSGVMARFAAVMVDLRWALRYLRQLVHGISADEGIALPPDMSGHGLAEAEAARGRLIHRVELQAGQVSRYQIVAPTEWNFHPQGAFVQGLQGQLAGDDPAFRVRLLVAALDPCVAARIEVL